MNEDERATQSAGDSGLEERLRRLPRPRVPAGLEEKLLAAIPASADELQKDGDRRGMSVPAMRPTGVSPVAGGGETPPRHMGKIPMPRPGGTPATRRRPLRLAFGAIAAGAVAAAAVLVAVFLPPQRPSPLPGAPTPAPAVASMSKEDILRALDREAMSAKWMASARVIAVEMGNPEEARRIRRYVAESFPETAAAKQTLDFPQTQQGETQ
jgi:hypothetical protein